MTDNIDRVKLQYEFDTASRSIKECKAGKLQGLENRYGLAYNAMARAGMAQPLKRKYWQK